MRVQWSPATEVLAILVMTEISDKHGSTVCIRRQCKYSFAQLPLLNYLILLKQLN